MRVVEINAYDFGSTGKIMLQISKCAEKNNIEMMTFSSSIKGRKFGKELESHHYIDSLLYTYIHRLTGGLFGSEFSFSWLSTWKLVRTIEKFDPDIIHLHNIHGYYLNLKILFRYLHNTRAKVVWTLHDCWSFTGRCPHYQISKCNKWKTGCYDCQFSLKTYPSSFLKDNSEKNYKLKKKYFRGIRDLTIVTPSKWLAEEVKKSILQEYKTVVINNGIDLKIFQPKPDNAALRSKCIEKKYIVLGVAFNYNFRKGLDVFTGLSKILPEEYQIVMVGTNEKVDAQLPKNIISINRTNNQEELAEIYSMADVFINPTREDNYPTVNMEAIACGTPVITFNTGGSPEILTGKTGIVLEDNTVESMYEAVRNVCENRVFSKIDCIEHARSFDMNDRFKDYIDLYKSI